jgi:XTP/dITP diphosphohydrolase
VTPPARGRPARAGADGVPFDGDPRHAASRESDVPAAGRGAHERPVLLVATGSSHKLRELTELLHLENARLVSLADVPVAGEPVEDGSTFESNAAAKARFYARASGLPTLADDSGVQVGALGGGPGVRTRRYAGDDATDQQNNVKLLGALRGLPPAERGARYRCVLAFADPSAPGPRGGIPVVFTRGTLEGRIAAGPKGRGGFGYDPIFEPEGEAPGGRTLGEWSAAEKNRVSHRARAARRMARLLAARGY